MASGPQHYKDAERNIGYARNSEPGSEKQSFHMQMALLHATLANAAATALNQGDQGMVPADWSEWREACAKGTPSAREGTCPGGC